MPELHRGQLQAIATYVNELVVNAPSKLFELTFGPALQNLESQFVRVSPWRELFDEYDFLSILHHCFAKFKEKLAGEYQGPIVGSEFEGLIPEIVAALSAYLASLPKAYDVFFELPSFPKYQVPEIRLSDTLSLIDTSAENHNEIKAFKGLLGVFADENNREPRLKRDSVYLRCRIDGYANGSINSYAIARALSLLKQFVFLGLQKKVLLKKGIADLFVENMYPHLPRTVDAVVWSAQDVFNEACRIKVPQDFSLYLYWIRINEEELRCHDGNSAASVLVGRPPNDNLERAGAVPGLLWSVLESTNFIESVSDAERIRTAIEWQFDADISNNETVAFLQRCIGLEAILGDDEQSRAIPITEKLADRYAYLLGKTASERKQLKDEFVLVYRKRSDLVHARRSQLTAGDRVVVDGARTILSKIIMNEVHWLVRRNRPS